MADGAALLKYNETMFRALRAKNSKQMLVPLFR